MSCPRVLVVELDPVVAAHLDRALATHRAWCRANGYRWEPALDDLAMIVDTNGQGRPTDGDALNIGEGVGDDHVHLLTYDDAGRRLSVSGRSVRRLVAEGKLRAVTIGGARRVHADAVKAYADRLRDTDKKGN